MVCVAECWSYIHSIIVSNSGKTSMNQAAINIRIMDIEPAKITLSQITDIEAMIRVAINCLMIFELSRPRSNCDADFYTQ